MHFLSIFPCKLLTIVHTPQICTLHVKFVLWSVSKLVGKNCLCVLFCNSLFVFRVAAYAYPMPILSLNLSFWLIFTEGPCIPSVPRRVGPQPFWLKYWYSLDWSPRSWFTHSTKKEKTAFISQWRVRDCLHLVTVVLAFSLVARHTWGFHRHRHQCRLHVPRAQGSLMVAWAQLLIRNAEVVKENETENDYSLDVR